MSKVIEGDYKDCRIIEPRNFMGSKEGIAISYGFAKLYILNAETVQRWQLVTESSDKDSASMAVRGLGGWLLFGGAGALIGAATTKSDGVILAIEFKDGKKSLITLEKEQFAKFKYSIPGEVKNISQAESPASSPSSPADVKTCPYCAETIKTAARICKHCGKEIPEDVTAEEVVAEFEDNASFPPAPTANVRTPFRRPPIVRPAEKTIPLNQSPITSDDNTPKKKRGCFRIMAYCFLGFFALAFLAAIFESPEDKQKRYTQEKAAPTQRVVEREAIRPEQQHSQQAFVPRSNQPTGNSFFSNYSSFFGSRTIPAITQKQLEVLENVLKYEHLYHTAKTERQREQIWQNMVDNIIQILGGYTVSDWVGFVAGTEPAFDAPQAYRTLTVTVSMEPALQFSTAFMSVVDENKTMIPRKSPLFNITAGLKKGDWVRFSGRIEPDSLDYQKQKARMVRSDSGLPYFEHPLFQFMQLQKIYE